MRKKYIIPDSCCEPMEARLGFLAASHEGYDTDPFETGFVMAPDTNWL